MDWTWLEMEHTRPKLSGTASIQRSDSESSITQGCLSSALLDCLGVGEASLGRCCILNRMVPGRFSILTRKAPRLNLQVPVCGANRMEH